MEYKFDIKFKLGEIVYTLIDKKITRAEINNIKVIINIGYSGVSVINIKYSLVLHDYTRKYLGYCDERDLYKTKEELINNL